MSVRLSVVTATFNAVKAGRADDLARCLRSVAALKSPHEHLILDGGSTDGTVERLHDLAASCPGARVISEPDTGIYNAFNKGWRMAVGEWVHYLGDDDYLIDPLALDEILGDLEGASSEMVLSPAERPGQVQRFRSPADMRSLLTVTPYCHQGVLMRRDLIARLGGFDERFRISADYDLLLKAHFANVPIRYAWKVYAFFNTGGVSAGSPAAQEDMASVTARHLGLSARQKELLKTRRLLPVWKLVPLVFHRSTEVRLAARHALKRRVAAVLGLLDATGLPKGACQGGGSRG